MKPPICEVCDERFAPADGELIRFLDHEASTAFADRMEEPGFVGHDPSTGWFCPTHVSGARARATSMTLPDALRDIGSGAEHSEPPTPETTSNKTDRAPITPVATPSVKAWPAGGRLGDGLAECATCSITFPERSGGHVEFFETYQVKVARSLADGDARFEHPSRRWFCPRHLGPAMLIRDSVGVADAQALLMPDGRDPLVYTEVPPGVSVGSADSHGEPMRGPFLPMPDPAFDLVDAEHHEITGRIAQDVAAIVRPVVADVQDVLGLTHMRGAGSISAPSADPADLVWAQAMNSTSECSTSVSSRHGGDVAMFTISARHLDGDEVLGEHVRLLVQQRERSIFEVVVVAGPESDVAPDGRVLLDHAHIRVAEDHRNVLAEPIVKLLDALRTAAGDPFSLSPDLDGVDLRGGQIRRSRGEGQSALEWELRPVSLNAARQQFVELVPVLFAQLGLGDVPELAVTTSRTWNPMDGAVEPNCPYVDNVRHEATAPDGRPAVSITSDAAHWNDDDISNVNVHLFVNVDGVRVSAFASGRGQHDACTSLSLFRPTSSDVVVALTSAFAEWLD